MKIGFSTSLLEPKITTHTLDGVGVYTKNLFENLKKTGEEITPYAFGSSALLWNNSVLGSRSLGVSFPTAAALGIVSSGAFKLKVDADIFHVTDQKIVPMSCPVVTTLYDAIPFMYPEYASQNLRFFRNWVKKAVAKFADRVITISHFCVDEIAQHYSLPTERISVVHCGVDDKWLIEPEREAVNLTLSRRNLRPGYFLFVGTLQPRKNIERIVDAYLTLPERIKNERELVIVGRPGWRCDELMRRLTRLNEENQLKWLKDVINFEELRQLYSGAGVFVFPSLYEGFGLPVVEAFASGLPVITSNSTSLPEVAAGAALEINPLVVDELTDAMMFLSEDANRRSDMIKLGRARAAQLSWEKTAAETVSVYRQLL